MQNKEKNKIIKSCFKNMVDNAFDFLKKAVSELETEPKYSIINFYSAIELFLKARLLFEHWTLILKKPDIAEIDKFIRGDFISISLHDACIRLEKIIKDPITQDELACFNHLREHRNKIVHFYHLDQLKNNSNIMESIASEQCLAWFYLENILLKRWNTIFKNYNADIIQINKKMGTHKKYLKVKFENLTDKIKTIKDEGYKFSKCPSCGFKSLQEINDEPFLKFKCLVCEFTQTGLMLNCPTCNKRILILSDGYGSCKFCDKEYTPEILAESLFDHAAAYLAIKDGDNYELGNCSDCDGFHTVVQFEGKYLCTSCLESFDSIEFCEWCNEPNTGNMENSYWNGCNHCDGKMGLDDKDE